MAVKTPTSKFFPTMICMRREKAAFMPSTAACRRADNAARIRGKATLWKTWAACSELLPTRFNARHTRASMRHPFPTMGTRNKSLSGHCSLLLLPTAALALLLNACSSTVVRHKLVAAHAAGGRGHAEGGGILRVWHVTHSMVLERGEMRKQRVAVARRVGIGSSGGGRRAARSEDGRACAGRSG